MASRNETVGLEVDGTRITLVVAKDGRAVSCHSADAGSVTASIEQVRSHIPSGAPVRVVVAGSGTRTGRVQLPTPRPDRQTLVDAVTSALQTDPEGRAIAGLISPTAQSAGSAGALTAAIGAVAPSGPIEEAYTALGLADARAVPGAFTLAGAADGVWLIIRWGSAEAVLIESGWPVASRTFNTGGLDAAVNEMTVSLPGSVPSLAVGIERLHKVLTGDQSDAQAAAVVETWQRRLSLELRSTCEHWRASGETVPTQVYAIGPGAVGTGLATWFDSVSLELVADQLVAAGVAPLPPEQRLAATTALLAARTTGVGEPAASFPNPLAIAALVKRERSRRRNKVLAVVCGLGLLAGAAVGVPYAVGGMRNGDADKALAAAQARLAAVGQVAVDQAETARLQGLATEVAGQQVNWPWLLGKVYASAPVGIDITSVTAQRNDDGTIAVIVAATAGGTRYSAPASWMKTLTTAVPTVDAWIPSLTTADGAVTFSIELTAQPVEPLVTARTTQGEAQ